MDKIDKIISGESIKYPLAFAVAAFVIVIGIISGSCMGFMDISPTQVAGVILNKTFGTVFEVPQNVVSVVWNIRLPRIICSFVVGAGLGVAGTIFQGILQNPLADPYTLGISTGASFGASIAILINIALGLYLPITPFALVFALITLFVVIKIAGIGSGFKSSNLIIAGIIVSSILSSGVSFIKLMAGENVSAIVFWIMGSFSAVQWKDTAMTLPVVLVCTALAIAMSTKLDIMAMGDKEAASLGINPDRLRLVLLIIGSLITAVCVSVCGVIGFIGLIVPHLLRYRISARNLVLVPLSALWGGALLLYADTLARVISTGEIPVGVLTTLIGGPFFIYVFVKKEDRVNG